MIRRLLWIAAAVIAIVPRPAFAQVPRVEATAGASVVRDPKNTVNLRGWWVEGAMRLRPGISLVGEADAAYFTQLYYAGDFEVDRQRLSVVSAMGGIRLSTRIWKLREFGQVLVGRLTSSGTDLSLVEQTPHFTAQPGLGLDFPLASRVALRVELDARYISKDQRGNENGVQFRLASGFAVALRR